MGNGDPVTQQQFADTMRQDKKEVLEAISTVNGSVQKNAVTLGKVETKLDNDKERMDAIDKRIDGQADAIDNQKLWNRGLAAVEVTLAALLAWLGVQER